MLPRVSPLRSIYALAVITQDVIGPVTALTN